MVIRKMAFFLPDLRAAADRVTCIQRSGGRGGRKQLIPEELYRRSSTE